VASISQKIKKIDYAIYHDPSLFKALLSDCSIKRGLLYSRLGRVIPHRVGIEFELLGHLAINYRKVHPEIKSEKQFSKHFNVYSYSEDLFDVYSRYEGNTELIITDLNEIRVSLTHPLQLSGLYKILIEMKRYCTNPIGGGIHIHVDFSKYSNESNIKIAAGYIKHHLHEVEAIFPEYTGSYNKREVGIKRKGTYVNFSNYKSIEFRIAPLTFDYGTLLDWLIKCSKFVSRVIKECHLKPVSKSDDVKNYHENGNRVQNRFITELNSRSTYISDQYTVTSYSSLNSDHNLWCTYNNLPTNSDGYSSTLDEYHSILGC
jgi:hypothetical protein